MLMKKSAPLIFIIQNDLINFMDIMIVSYFFLILFTASIYKVIKYIHL